MIRNEINNKTKLNNYLYSLIIMIPLLNLILSRVFSISNPGIIFASIVSVLFLWGVFQKTIKFYTKGLFVLLIIMLSFIYSYFIVSDMSLLTTTLVDFIYYGALSFLIGFSQVNIKRIIELIIIVSMCTILDYKLFIEVIPQLGYLPMNYSYAFLPSIISTILYVMYFKKDLNIILILGCFFNILLLYVVIIDGTRGALLALLIFAIVMITNYFKNNKQHIRIITLISIMIVSLVVLINFENILKETYLFLEDIGLEFNLFTKSYNKLLQDNLLNNRDILYTNSINGFFKSPIFGNGISEFEYIYGIYPHNFVLQIMNESGVIVLIVILLPIIKSFSKVYTEGKVDQNRYLLWVLLMVISIPRITFSTNYLYQGSFWLLLANCILITSRNSKTRHNNDLEQINN